MNRGSMTSERAAAAEGYAPSRRPRWGTLALVALLHLVALAALVRVFAPDFTAAAIEQATSLVTVTVTSPPEPGAKPLPSPETDVGAAGEESREAAPEVLPRSAPRASSSGTQDSAGAGEQGEADGVVSAGEGPGIGAASSGQGGGARPLALVSGAIDNARDYPTPPGGRRVRRGHDVVIELTVGPEGRVAACRVTDPSPDPEADVLTCRLASERFVFRPRLNSAGEPVTGLFRWRQRWF